MVSLDDDLRDGRASLAAIKALDEVGSRGRHHLSVVPTSQVLASCCFPEDLPLFIAKQTQGSKPTPLTEPISISEPLSQA